MTGDNALIKVDDLTKPATVLIEKISEAIGGYYKPFQIKRVAKAEAEAEKIKAEAQIEVTDIQRRALTRFVSEETKKQENIENITKKSLPFLNDDSNPQNIEDDWITNFFDKCRIISDEEMQLLWARVLAGEANIPGTYSKRTVNLLNSLDKDDARMFTALCGFVWHIDDLPIVLVYDSDAQIYNEASINFTALNHLDVIGLVCFNPMAGFVRSELSQSVTLSYHGKPITVDLKSPDHNKLKVGKAILTQAGEELALICGAQPVDGFFDYVVEKFKKEGYI